MSEYIKMKGFTLIELMITVLIVGIIGAVAFPAYQNYVIKAQVSEGLNIVTGLQTVLSENYAQNGTFAPDLASLGVSTPITGKYVSGVTVASGAITVTFGSSSNSAIHTGTIVLTPKPDASGNVHWACEPDGLKIKARYVPSSCTNT